MEPLLCVDPGPVIAEVRPYVTDSIWLGKPNKLLQRLAANGASEEVCRAGQLLHEQQSDAWCHELHRRFGADPLIRWKDSIKTVLGLERATRAGEDR